MDVHGREPTGKPTVRCILPCTRCVVPSRLLAQTAAPPANLLCVTKRGKAKLVVCSLLWTQICGTNRGQAKFVVCVTQCQMRRHVITCNMLTCFKDEEQVTSMYAHSPFPCMCEKLTGQLFQDAGRLGPRRPSLRQK